VGGKIPRRCGNFPAIPTIIVEETLFLMGVPMGILAWIILGLVAGILAKLILPGDDPGGFIVTIIIGIVGALIGGYIGTHVGWGDVTGFNLPSIGLAILGAILLLLGYRVVARGR
jgi:uncharacterized membrane protein YeaQ/YmgE (transglycosylase-associated protein family)